MFLQTMNFVKVTTHSTRHEITMGTCKTKTISADLGIFIHFMVLSAGLRISVGHQMLSGVKFNMSGVIWSSNGQPVRHKILVSS